ncbi:MAG: ATP-dependent DNA helicase [Candidatus Bipolaricaulota bacterium]
MADALEGLNHEQRWAVAHGQGPVLVLAGVGTGKTTVIARRIAFLIAEGLVQRPSQLLVFTFSRWAAEEMLDRAFDWVGYGALDAWVATFHSVCERILRENAPLAGLPPDFGVLDEWEQRLFVLDHLWELPWGRLKPRVTRQPLRMVGPVLSLLSRAKDEAVSPEAFSEWAAEAEETGNEAEAARELAAVYSAYQELLAGEGLVDFGDLILRVVRLLEENPGVLDGYQERFPYILADEFQDTSRAQFRLVQLLGGHRNVTAVGDDDQAIYGFRGVPWDNLRAFLAHFPEARVVTLTRNYRSTQEILDAAGRLIQHNQYRLEALSQRGEIAVEISKDLRSAAQPASGPKPMHRQFPTALEEAEFLAQETARLAAEGLPYREMAVLYRNRYRPDPYLRALSEKGVPWILGGRSGEGLFDQEDVKLIVSFLRQVADPDDSLALHHLAGSELYDVPAEDLSRLTAVASGEHRPLAELAAAAARGEAMCSEEGRDRLSRLLGDLDRSRQLSRRCPAGQVLYEYLATQTGHLERLASSTGPEAVRRLEHVAQFFEQGIRRFEQVARYDRVPWFVLYLENLMALGYNPLVGQAEPDTEAVQVLTFHQAKGLEYGAVFLTGLVEDYMPGRARRPTFPLPMELVGEDLPADVAHLEEQRRLFYVGMTRAKHKLYLLSAADYRAPGEEPRKRPAKVSRFVAEALGPGELARQAPASPASMRIARMARDPARVEAPSAVEGRVALSHQRVDDYLTCPLKYRYVHLLRVPIALHHSVVFGHAVHRGIQAYHMARAQGRTLPLEEVLAVCRNAWRSEGFFSAEHEQQLLSEAEEALEAFHSFEQAEGTRPAEVERYFAFVEGGARVIGYWDRVDRDDDHAVIIDYKTSLARSQDANRRARESLQLAIYALAHERLYGAPPDELQLRFLTPEVVVGKAKPTPRMLEKAREAIAKAEAGVRAADFSPRPSLFACRPCAYRSICPAAHSV